MNASSGIQTQDSDIRAAADGKRLGPRGRYYRTQYTSTAKPDFLLTYLPTSYLRPTYLPTYLLHEVESFLRS